MMPAFNAMAQSEAAARRIPVGTIDSSVPWSYPLRPRRYLGCNPPTAWSYNVVQDSVVVDPRSTLTLAEEIAAIQRYNLKPPAVRVLMEWLAPEVLKVKGHPERNALRIEAKVHFDRMQAAHEESMVRIRLDKSCECSARGVVGRAAEWSHGTWCPPHD